MPLGRIRDLPEYCNIFEMVNVFVALNLWKQRLAGKSMIIHCYNAAVVSTLNSGRASDQFLVKVARNIWLITATLGINLEVCHIPGKKNVLADTLFRLFEGGINSATIHNLASYQWCPVRDSDMARVHAI